MFEKSIYKQEKKTAASVYIVRMCKSSYFWPWDAFIKATETSVDN